MTRALAAMSGGVDSSVTALILREQGYDVVGVFMRNGVSSDRPACEKSCCSASDAHDASAVAEHLQIPFYALDYEIEFAEIMSFFADEYRRGRTPSPCVLCNQQLKFGQLFSAAAAVEADLVATGHFARVEDGKLYRAVDQNKDQTYYLFGIKREVLGRILFPLGGMTKPEVRARAEAAGLSTAQKAESMEICFVPGGDYREMVRQHGGPGRPGHFVLTDGRVVGEHDGIDAFTVGQRRGLPAMGHPIYVQSIDAETGDVQLCEREGLLSQAACVRQVNWLDEIPSQTGIEVGVKIRARARDIPAIIRPSPEDPTRVDVEFLADASAVTPGQAAVFYRGDQVLGGGWLD